MPPLVIAYQGVKGAFSSVAAEHSFWDYPEATYVGLPTFEKIFLLLEKGEAHYGVLPIENSLVGSIYENYDLLTRYNMTITKEYHMRIEHTLLGTGSEFAKLKQVLSHPKALEQCKGFFKLYPWIKAIPHEDTAGAAQEIAQKDDPSLGAISHDSAAQLYGLNILQRNVEDNKNNYTRFVCIQKNPVEENQNQGNKCSLILVLKHEPNALYSVLEVMSRHHLNISKLESRPMLNHPFEYLFYFDLEWDGQKKNPIHSLTMALKEKAERVQCLGIYNAENLWNS